MCEFRLTWKNGGFEMASFKLSGWDCISQTIVNQSKLSSVLTLQAWVTRLPGRNGGDCW